jgi:hypothetical protein
MLTTALAMAPGHPYRFTGGDKSHCAAQAAAALSLIAHFYPLSRLPVITPSIDGRPSGCHLRFDLAAPVTNALASFLLAMKNRGKYHVGGMGRAGD